MLSAGRPKGLSQRREAGLMAAANIKPDGLAPSGFCVCCYSKQYLITLLV